MSLDKYWAFRLEYLERKLFGAYYDLHPTDHSPRSFPSAKVLRVRVRAGETTWVGDVVSGAADRSMGPSVVEAAVYNSAYLYELSYVIIWNSQKRHDSGWMRNAPSVYRTTLPAGIYRVRAFGLTGSGPVLVQEMVDVKFQ